MSTKTPNRASARLVFTRLVESRPYLFAIAASALVGGCTWFQNDAKRGYFVEGTFVGARMITSADVRVISQRNHPVTGQVVSCTEPTPDVAKALSTASQISLKGGNKSATGELGFSGSSAEAVAELAGRSTALLALRDGLFRVCEAYMNGAIGSDAYALVLSRYGQLMTTLFLAEDIQSAARTSNSATSPSTTPPVSPSKANDGKSDTPPANPSSSRTAAPRAETAELASNTDERAEGITGTDAASDIGFLRVAAPGTKKKGARAAGSPGSPGAAESGSGTPASNPTADAQASAVDADTENAGNAKPGGAAMSNPEALLRLNQGYFDLDKDIGHQLVVACIDEYDLTRKRLPVANPAPAPPGSDALVDFVGHNAWLTKLCASIDNLQSLKAALQEINHAQRPAGSAAPPAGARPHPARTTAASGIRDPNSSRYDAD